MSKFPLKRILLVLLFAVSFVIIILYLSAWFLTLTEVRHKHIPNLGNQSENLLLAEKDTQDSFQFGVLGDIQQGIAGMKRLLDKLSQQAEKISFLVITGDTVCHGDKYHYGFFVSEIEEEGIKHPVFVTPGNHDVTAGKNHYDQSLFEKYFGHTEVFFISHNCLFIILDDALTPLQLAQYEWLENLLNKYRPAVSKIFVFMHRPPINGPQYNKENTETSFRHFHELVKKYHIDYVFSGHAHTFFRCNRDGCAYVVNGLGGDYDVGHGNWPFHSQPFPPALMTIIKINGDKVAEEIIGVTGGRDWWDEYEYFCIAYLYPIIDEHLILSTIFIIVVIGLIIFSVIKVIALYRTKKLNVERQITL